MTNLEAVNKNTINHLTSIHFFMGTMEEMDFSILILMTCLTTTCLVMVLVILLKVSRDCLGPGEGGHI